MDKIFVKSQLCVDPNGHELQLEEAKRLLHVDLVKTMARKKTYHQTYKNVIFGYKNCNSFYYIVISIIEENLYYAYLIKGYSKCNNFAKSATK